MSVANNKTLRGDTLVEVMFAIGIFALVAISVSNLMNSMLGKSQSSIEIVMARSEIDAQAEAIRFIHSAYKDARMQDIWEEIKDLAVTQAQFDNTIYPIASDPASCDAFSNPDFSGHAFYIDTFNLNNTNVDNIIKRNASVASIFPRIVHTEFDDADIVSGNFDEKDDSGARAEGIWVIAIADQTPPTPAEYYDFYVQTCWHQLGNPMPSTITTVFRLNNPGRI